VLREEEAIKDKGFGTHQQVLEETAVAGAQGSRR
jgi:hypothetical protein